MEALNISLDNNEADTSNDELEEDPDFRLFPSKMTLGGQNHEVISSAGLFKVWERPGIDEGLFYSGSGAQPEPFQFLFLDSVSSVSGIRQKGIRQEESLEDATLLPVMRLFGVARIPELEDEFGEVKFSEKATYSVCCNVHGFIPYFYALPTIGCRLDSEGFRKIKEELEGRLDRKVTNAILRDLSLVEVHDFLDGSKAIVKVEGVEVRDVENSIFHFPGNVVKDLVVFKVFVGLPMFVRVAADILDKLKVELDDERECEFEIFERSLSNNIRFLADQNIPGCTWLELGPNAYFRREEGGRPDKESHCQIELDVHYGDVKKVSEPPEGIPPLRILSFDIECRVSATMSNNQVIQIGAVLGTYGVPGNPTIGKAAFVLGSCDGLPDTKVIQFYNKNNIENCTEENLLHSEAKMMASFRDFVVQMDPDIVTGYNVKNFDLPCMIERAEKFVHRFEELRRFPYMGRLKKVKVSIRPIVNEDKRLYKYDKNIINLQGRVIMDMYPLLIRHELGRSSLKLKNAAKRYLGKGEEKDDIKFDEINGLQNGDSKTRNRLAKYCVQDAYLPLRLMYVFMPDRKSDEINFLEYYFENSQLGGTILRYLVNKSKDYNIYFKQVRVQKNNGRVRYHPDSPVKKSPVKNGAPSTSVIKPVRKITSSRMLFTDD